MNKVNWFKKARLWIQRHKWISIVAGIITAIVGIIRIRDFLKVLWIAIKTFINSFSITLNFWQFSAIILPAFLFLLMSAYFSIKRIFKTTEKKKLENTKSEVIKRLNEWRDLIKNLDAIENKPKPQSKLPEHLRRLDSEASLQLAILKYNKELENEYSTFLASCETLKSYSDNQIAQFALEHPVIDSFAKQLKMKLLGNLKLDISKTEASFRMTRNFLNHIIDTWENTRKTLEQEQIKHDL